MPVIAISRGSLYAARKLAEGLKERLGYKLITREEVIDAAKRHGIEETGLGEKDIMELHPPGYWHTHSDQRSHYLACFKTALLDFAIKDSIIYHGNLAHVLLNEVPFVLRVRINAPLENRVSQLMENEGTSKEEAAEKVRDMDHKRRLWTQFLYDAEVVDPVFFDLVLNLERISIDDAIEMVVSESQKAPFQPTEKSMQALKDIHLASVVKTHLYRLKLPDVKIPDFDVVADSSSGRVILKSNIPVDKKQRIENDIYTALTGIEAIKQLEVDL
jgi:cytidylate kinase